MATQADLNFVQQLYVAYYGRPADSAGLQYWADRAAEEGQSAIVNAFGESQEYQDQYSSLTNIQKVNNLYQQLFARDAEPAGLDYWTGVLARGEKSLAEIAVTIENAAQGSDAEVFDAKVAAAEQYTDANADSYDVDAAKAVVTEAGSNIAANVNITAALNELQSAQQELNDFLASADGDNDPSTATDGTALKSELSNLQGQIDSAPKSLNVLKADVTDAQEAETAYETQIAKVEGLQAAINAKDTAVADLEAAQKAAVVAGAEADAAETIFESNNTAAETGLTSNADVVLQKEAATAGNYEAWTAADPVSDLVRVVDTANSNNVLYTVENGQLTKADTTTTADIKKYVGLDALGTELQDQVNAELALEKANTADTTADDNLTAITDFTGTTITEADGSAVYTQLNTLEKNVATEKAEVTEREELIADRDEAQAQVDQFNKLDTEVTEARAALTNDEANGGLGVELKDASGATSATADEEVFLFEEGATANITGFSADDRLYAGSDYTLVELAADADLSTSAQGDVNTKEVFLGADGSGNAVLSFENEAFAGSSTTGAADITEITLTGVTADQLSYENGFFSIA